MSINMRCLYLSLIDINNQDGYDRKTLGQLRAFSSYGWLTSVVCYKGGVAATGVFDGEHNAILWNKSTGASGSLIKRRLSLFLVSIREIANRRSQFLYVRYPRADLFFAVFLAIVKLVWPKIVIVSEIPTYPFDKEESPFSGVRGVLAGLNEKMFRSSVTSLVSAYAVIAYSGRAFGKSSIRVENGVDYQELDDFTKLRSLSSGIDLVFVANFAANNYRHGIDRLLRGLAKYGKQNEAAVPVRLHIVGDVSAQKTMFEGALGSHSACNVIFHGKKTFAELMDLYGSMHIGIGCLGFHRIGVTHTSALKEREYLSFGLPIVSSSADYSFDREFPYRLRLSDDDSDIEIERIVSFAIRCYEQTDVRRRVQEAAHSVANWAKSMSNLRTFVEG